MHLAVGVFRIVTLKRGKCECWHVELMQLRTIHSIISLSLNNGTIAITSEPPLEPAVLSVASSRGRQSLDFIVMVVARVASARAKSEPNQRPA